MTDAAPAGWYPDATNQGQQRWWDGQQWTEHVQSPYVAGAAHAALKAPEGVSASTPHIWWIVGLFGVSMVSTLVYLGTFDWGGYLRLSMNPTDMSGLGYLLIGYLVFTLVSLGVYAGSVVLAFADWKALNARGVPRPFHWAFAFISSIVYVIGRSVVARRRTGGGLEPMWVLIGLYVAYFIAGMVVTFAGMGSMFSAIPSYSYN